MQSVADKDLMQRQRKISQLKERYNLPTSRTNSQDGRHQTASKEQTGGAVHRFESRGHTGERDTPPQCYYQSHNRDDMKVDFQMQQRMFQTLDVKESTQGSN